MLIAAVQSADDQLIRQLGDLCGSLYSSVIDQVRDKKAIVFYAADHVSQLMNASTCTARRVNWHRRTVPCADDGLDVG